MNIHPDAAANFNQKAEELIAKVRPSPRTRETSKFRGDPYITASLTEADIVGTPRRAFVNAAGHEIARFFQASTGETLGIVGTDFRDLQKIAEGLQRISALRPVVSLETVVDLVFEWVEARHKKTVQGTVIEYMLPKIQALIRRQEVWVPIADLYIESSFALGRTMFRPLTPGVFQAWETAILRDHPEHAVPLKELLKEQRKRYQGLAAAITSVEAEPRRAKEIAFANAEDATTILRIFHGATLIPQMICRCVPFGREFREEVHCLLVQDDKLVQASSAAVGAHRPWQLSDAELIELRSGGLEKLSALLLAERRTDFQDVVLNAVRLYSRSGLAASPSDRLVYILTALESIFVRNRTEPLQDNIAHRMAFLISREREPRRRIIETVKGAYELRSAFLHHGERLEDLERFTRFMAVALRCMLAVVAGSERFESLEAFQTAIDDERLS